MRVKLRLPLMMGYCRTVGLVYWLIYGRKGRGGKQLSSGTYEGNVELELIANILG